MKRPHLTERELEVVLALVNGHITSQRLADHLKITERTARCHLSRIYLKIGAVNMSDLILIALGRRITPVTAQITAALTERGAHAHTR